MDTPEEVAAWIADHEREHGNGVAGLRAALTRGIISGRGALVARAWLDEHENGARRRVEAEQLDLARRSTEATEAASAASVKAARHAGESATWAKIATVISVLALVVSAWPPLKELLTPGVKQPAPTPVHVAPTPPAAGASRR